MISGSLDHQFMIQQGYTHTELMEMTELEFLSELEDAQEFNKRVNDEMKKQSEEK